MTQPGFSVWSGFLGALIYYLTNHVLQFLTRDEAKALITTLFVAHGLLVDISGYSWDYTYPIARLIHGEPCCGCWTVYHRCAPDRMHVSLTYEELAAV